MAPACREPHDTKEIQGNRKVEDRHGRHRHRLQTEPRARGRACQPWLGHGSGGPTGRGDGGPGRPLTRGTTGRDRITVWSTCSPGQGARHIGAAPRRDRSFLPSAARRTVRHPQGPPRSPVLPVRTIHSGLGALAPRLTPVWSQGCVSSPRSSPGPLQRSWSLHAKSLHPCAGVQGLPSGAPDGPTISDDIRDNRRAPKASARSRHVGPRSPAQHRSPGNWPVIRFRRAACSTALAFHQSDCFTLG